MLDDKMVPMPATGRIFRGRRRIRLADADARGRLRLDACARYLQDIGNDDTADSGLDDLAGPWVVRRAVVDVHTPPQWGEWVDLATWCSGTGNRWAGRRLSIVGGNGAAVEMDTLWVHLDPEKMVPARLPESFLEIYGGAAGGRRIKAKHWLGAPSDEQRPSLDRHEWPLRAVDIDVMRHVNNAAYWAAIEEVLVTTRHPLLGAPVRAVLEYGGGIPRDAGVELLVADDRDAGTLDVWFSADGDIAATARLLPLP